MKVEIFDVQPYKADNSGSDPSRAESLFFFFSVQESVLSLQQL